MKLGCIRSVQLSTGYVSTYSGNCKYRTTQKPKTFITVQDGPIANATFSQPNYLYQPPNTHGVLLVSDNEKIRALDYLPAGSVRTLISLHERIRGLVWKRKQYFVALKHKIQVYDECWIIQEDAVSRWITRLDLIPIRMSYRQNNLNNFFDGSVQTGGYDFQIFDFDEDHIILYFNREPCLTCRFYLYPPADYRAVALFSVTNMSVVIMLYDSHSYDDLGIRYPTAMTSSKGDSILFSVNDPFSDPVYCSLVKKHI